MDVVVRPRRAGKARDVEAVYERFAFGFDTSGACGCGIGVLVGMGPDGVVTVLQQVDVKCAKHDVVEGEVVRPAIGSGSVG